MQNDGNKESATMNDERMKIAMKKDDTSPMVEKKN